VVFAQIAKSAPSFSGAYYDRTDRDGRMIIRLSDMSQAMVAEQTLRDILSKTPRRISTVTARIAKYSFLALSDWRDSVFLTAPAGLIYTIDIDEEGNRVNIGVKSDEGIATIRAIAKRTAIPDDAWSIYLAPEPGFRSTLIDRTRPVQGGVIHRPGPFGGAYCSVGVNGEWQFSQSYRGFLTASHCTVAYLQLDASTTYTFQNSIITNDSLAYEFDDPTYFTGGSCAVGARCRYSDVAFFRYLNGSSSGLGTIARTMYSDSGAPGSTTISGQFTIAGDWPYSFLYEQLQKVGATTGWTYGSTIATCQNHLSQSGSPA